MPAFSQRLRSARRILFGRATNATICSFCGEDRFQTQYIVAGPGVAICGSCAQGTLEVIAAQSGKPVPDGMRDFFVLVMVHPASLLPARRATLAADLSRAAEALDCELLGWSYSVGSKEDGDYLGVRLAIRNEDEASLSDRFVAAFLLPSAEEEEPVRPARSSVPAIAAISVLPPEGAAHPVFEEMLEGDLIELFYAFRPVPERRALSREEAQPWHEALKADCAQVVGLDVPVAVHWNATATRFAFAKTPRHREVLAAIIARASSYLVPVNQIVIRRGAKDENWEIESPAQDPRAPETHEPTSDNDLFERTFGAGEPPPSVDPAISFMVGTLSGGGMAPELRLSDPYRPDIRVVGHLGVIEPVETDPADARAGEIMRGLRGAIERHWPLGVPRPRLLNRAGMDATYVDRLTWHGRAGFGFAVMRDTEAMVQPLVDALRMREDELIGAVAEVVRAEGLHPVINWSREDSVLIFNLWE